MKPLHFFLLACLLTTGCKDDEGTEGPAPVFKIKLSDMTATGIKMDVKPASDADSYFFDIVSKSKLDEYHASSVKTYVTNLIGDETMWGDKTQEEFIASITTIGKTEYETDNLSPKTDYVAFAIGLNSAGVLTTEPAIKTFTTPELRVDLSFTCNVLKREIDNIDFEIIPDNNDETYFITIKPLYYCQQFDSNEELLQTIINENSSMIDYMLDQGKFTATSEDDIPFTYYSPDTRYELLVFGYRSGVGASTPLNRFEIQTKASETPASACTFGFEVTDLKVTSATVNVTPSNKFMPYVWDLIEATAYEEYKNNFNAYIAAYVEQAGIDYFETIRVHGDQGETYYETLDPNTTYYVWAACLDDLGVPSASAVFSTPFSTPERSVSDIASVSITLGKYFDGDEVAATYPGQDFAKDVAGKAYVSLNFASGGEVSTWYGGMFEDDMSEIDDETIIETLENDWDYMYPTGKLYTCDWDHPYTAIAFAKDKMGNYTAVRRQIYTFTKSGASPIGEFVVPGAKSARATLRFPQSVPQQQAPRVYRTPAKREIRNRK